MIEKPQLTLEEIDLAFAMYPMANILIFNESTDPKGLNPMKDYLQGIDFIKHRVFGEFCSYKQSDVKLVLHQLQHITDQHIYSACYAYENIPFCDTQPQDWRINRESDVIQVWHKSKKHSYVFDQYNGNVNAFIYGRHSTLGKQAAVVQFLIRHCYALPLYFQPKHFANGKTLHQIGLAAPNFATLLNVLGSVYDKDENVIQEYFFNKRLEEIQLHNINVYNIQLELFCNEHNLKLTNFL